MPAAVTVDRADLWETIANSSKPIIARSGCVRARGRCLLRCATITNGHVYPLIFLFSWPSNLCSRPWLVTRSLRVRPSFTNSHDALNAARRAFIETRTRFCKRAFASKYIQAHSPVTYNSKPLVLFQLKRRLSIFYFICLISRENVLSLLPCY